LQLRFCKELERAGDFNTLIAPSNDPKGRSVAGGRSGESPVKGGKNRGLFTARSRSLAIEVGSFLTNQSLSPVLTSQGSQVQSLPRPPFFLQ